MNLTYITHSGYWWLGGWIHPSSFFFVLRSQVLDILEPKLARDGGILVYNAHDNSLTMDMAIFMETQENVDNTRGESKIKFYFCWLNWKSPKVSSKFGQTRCLQSHMNLDSSHNLWILRKKAAVFFTMWINTTWQCSSLGCC